MTRASLHVRLLVAATLSLAACGGDDDGETTVDAGGPDAAFDGCDEAGALPSQYRLVGMVSTGEVTTTAGEGVTEAVIDATAGGLAGAADNPYVYIDLESGVKIDIDDVDSISSTEWDVAFKRSSIRVNGGDSGPGGVAVAVVTGALDDVTEAPADGEFETDDWVSDACVLLSLPGGEPATAFGEWYDYDEPTHVLTPKGEVHVVRTRSGSFVKLAIDTYYGDDADPMRGAFYRAAWAPL